MKVHREGEEKGGALVFQEMEPFLAEMLRQLPGDSDPGDNAAARARLFGDPMGSAGDRDGFNEDWRQFVQPEIRDLFRTAREQVADDLSGLPPAKETALRREGDMIQFDPVAFSPGKFGFKVPIRHAEAWLSVLNQARLVLAARRGFGEAAMDEEWSFPPFSDRDLDLFKVHFYDMVQQIFLREMGFE